MSLVAGVQEIVVALAVQPAVFNNTDNSKNKTTPKRNHRSINKNDDTLDWKLFRELEARFRSSLWEGWENSNKFLFAARIGGSPMRSEPEVVAFC